MAACLAMSDLRASLKGMAFVPPPCSSGRLLRFTACLPWEELLLVVIILLLLLLFKMLVTLSLSFHFSPVLNASINAS